eukprot:GILI01006617.1.p1 GENE.GILI01006617.1~~GILI01006617.1.p1  ORF type:complete len:255 (+),score=42.05 GILI01006617.1:153-917(+)
MSAFDRVDSDASQETDQVNNGKCGVKLGQKCPLNLASPCGDELVGSPFSGSGTEGAGGTRMSKFRRMQLNMGLSIGDVCTFQTHHSDEHTPAIAAATCQEMSQITDFLFLGSWRDSAEGAGPALKAKGITHVLNLAREQPLGEENRPDVVYVTIPMNDDHQEDLYERLMEAHAFINTAKREGGKVLVHCRRGISRSPTIVVSYLMKYNHLTYDQALAYVEARRHVSLNLAFREFLQGWDPVLGKPPTSARRAET